MKEVKPRSQVCWECGRLLRQRKIFEEVMVDGHPRILHKQCAEKIKGEKDESKSKAFD